MTTRRKRTRLRQHQDEAGLDAPAQQQRSGEGAREQAAGGAPAHPLLQLQAQRGNAAVQRLVTGAPQLQRDLEDEDEQQQAPAEDDIYEGLDEDPQAAMIAAMWGTGMVTPVATAIEQMESGSPDDLKAAYENLKAAQQFSISLTETMQTHFPDLEPVWWGNQEGVSLVGVGLRPYTGSDYPLEGLVQHLKTVHAQLEMFPDQLKGS